MSDITGDFVARLAKIWHRFTLPAGEEQTLADMLQPMDDAGETVARRLAFDMEPADFETALENCAHEERKS